MREMRSEKLALVFAGGGSLGAVQVGMLEAIVERDLRVDLVVGSSVGAINAAYFAGDPTARGVARLARIWRSVRRQDVFPLSPLDAVLGIFSWRDHLVSPQSLRRLLRRHLPYERLEQAVVPCHLVATDLLTGDEVCLSSGPAVDALLASAAIPAVFPPVELAGRLLIDGGVSSNTPVATAVALGATRLLVLPTGLSCPVETHPRGANAVALHALTLLVEHQLARDVRELGGRVPIHVVPPPCPVTASPYDFSEVGELIERAAETARRWIRRCGRPWIERAEPEAVSRPRLALVRDPAP